MNVFTVWKYFGSVGGKLKAASCALCVQVLPFDDNLCINEPCLNYEHCVSEQRFGNASSVVGTDSVMFRPLHMSSTITCTCPVGFTGILRPNTSA